MPRSARSLLVASLGRVGYADALELQRAAARARLDGSLGDDVLILLEHDPVVTTGRTTKPGTLLLDTEALASRGIERFDVERGGDVTFHGPGQIVGYPIMDLRRHREDLHWYLRQIEQALIDALGTFGIAAARNPGRTGVWTRDRKIASIGVHARQWVTWHGFALNVTNDLSFFDVIVPCGLPGVVMTSVERELLDSARGACFAPSPSLDDDVRDAVTAAAGHVFALEPVLIAEEELRSIVAAAGSRVP